MQIPILWQGLSENWLADKRYQVIFGITPELGISILGPEHRSDYLYGLPDRIEKGFEHGTALLEKEVLACGQNQQFKVVVIRFLQPAEYPEVPHNAKKGNLRFQTVGYIGITDAYNQNWSGFEIQELIRSIQAHGLSGIRPDTYLDEDWQRSLKFHRFTTEFNRAQVLVAVDPDFNCSANPHPQKEPATFAFCQLNGDMPKGKTLVGIYVWKYQNVFTLIEVVRNNQEDTETGPNALHGGLHFGRFIVGSSEMPIPHNLQDIMPPSFEKFILDIQMRGHMYPRQGGCSG